MSARRALFIGVLVVSALILVELGTRIVFSIATGRSLLLYGLTDPTAEQKRGMLFPTGIDRANWHEVFAADDREKAFVEHAAGAYSKYHPHQYKRTRDEYGHEQQRVRELIERESGNSGKAHLERYLKEWRRLEAA